MKKIYKKPIMRPIYLSEEICQSIVSTSSTLNVYDEETGQVEGGMTNKQQSGSSLWDNWNND